MFSFASIFIAGFLLYFYYDYERPKCGSNFNPNNIICNITGQDIWTYKLFLKHKNQFNFSDHPKNLRYYIIPYCKWHSDELALVKVKKNKRNLKVVEMRYIEIKAGGFYAPTNCRAKYRVAILVTYRDRETNLIIFLSHMHSFMKKQLVEYRIFVIEQIGKDKFNKGALYNIGYIVSHLFGKWHCFVFHDVDLLPVDNRILYSCNIRQPTHMSSAVESLGYRLPYYNIFGGVSILKPTHYEAVNGYSNCYWDWGAEDDDMYSRLRAQKLPVIHYSLSVGRFATLPHPKAKPNSKNKGILYSAEKRYKNEGLNSIEFKLINITERKLFTYILADVNPENRMKNKQSKCGK